jgi:hypothetical protein
MTCAWSWFSVIAICDYQHSPFPNESAWFIADAIVQRPRTVTLSEASPQPAIALVELPLDESPRLLKVVSNFISPTEPLFALFVFLGVLRDFLAELLDLVVLMCVFLVLFALVLDAVPEADRRRKGSDERGAQRGYYECFLRGWHTC